MVFNSIQKRSEAIHSCFKVVIFHVDDAGELFFSANFPENIVLTIFPDGVEQFRMGLIILSGWVWSEEFWGE